MIKIIINITLCFFLLSHTNAQRPDGPWIGGQRDKAMDEQIEAERIAYFTGKMHLTADEAQHFWPVYNEMDRRRKTLFDERAAIIRQFMNDTDKAGEQQIEESLNRLVSIQQQEAQLPSEYDVRFRKILPARKVMSLYVAEVGFRHYLLQKMRSRNGHHKDE